MGRIVDPLCQMGAVIDTDNGRLPIKITGKRPLTAIDHTLPVASAQVKSCLMIAGLLADGETVVTEPVPTRDHSERMLRHFGVDVRCGHGTVRVNGDARLSAKEISVAGDISAAAFFLIAAACLPGSEIKVTDIGLNPTRRGFLDILRNAGVDLNVSVGEEKSCEPTGAVVIRGHDPAPEGQNMLRLSGPDIPGIIDELPILAVFGACMGGIEIRDAGELRYKETDRIAAVVEDLRGMRADIEEFPDGLRVKRSNLKGAVVDSFGDHRIAMAFAVAGLVAEGETEIIRAECVDVSFPGFFDVLAGVSR
jgi:3-phosphoshikimate 1-carboxyvinyltransferase